MKNIEKSEGNRVIKTKIARTAVQTAMLMAILTLGSKLLGFIREMVMAGFFGTSYITDAYVMAIAIPGMIFGGIFGAVATSYMPLFSKIRATEGIEKGNRFTSETINLLVFVSIISAFVGLAFSDQIVDIFASGFEGETAGLTSFFVKITFAYVIFTSVTGILEAFLRYHGIFLTPIIIGYLQNIIVIVTIIVSSYFNYYYLAFGWLAAYVLRFIIVFRVTKKRSFNHSFSMQTGWAAKQIILLSLPVFFGSSINQINIFVDKALASRLQVGSVAALNYGDLLVGLITGLTVTIMMTVIYPKMTQAQSADNYKRFNEIVSSGFNLICIITIPCSLGAMLYSEQIVQIIYERGAFDAAATELTATAFFYYLTGMAFISLNSLFIQTYYSMHDMKTPVLYVLFGAIINIILNLILVNYMAHGGLALATSIAATCNTFLLYYGLRKKYPQVTIIESNLKIIKIVIAAVVAISISWVAYYIVGNVFWMPRMVLLGAVVLIAVIMYLVMLIIFKVKDINLLKSIFGKGRKCT